MAGTINGKNTLGPCLIQIVSPGDAWDAAGAITIDNREGGAQVLLSPELYNQVNDEQALPQSTTFVKVDCKLKFVTDNTAAETLKKATAAYLKETATDSGVFVPRTPGENVDDEKFKVIVRPVGSANDADDFIIEYGLNVADKQRTFKVDEKEVTEFEIQCYSGTNGSFKFNSAKPQV